MKKLNFLLLSALPILAMAEVDMNQSPVTAQISAYKNVITPDDYGPDWQVRAMMMWMFPRK